MSAQADLVARLREWAHLCQGYSVKNKPVSEVLREAAAALTAQQERIAELERVVERQQHQVGSAVLADRRADREQIRLLRAALRRAAIHPRGKYDGCRTCVREWLCGTAEQHLPGCLAAPIGESKCPK